MQIPSFADQADLATRVRAALPGVIELDGRRFSVVQLGNEIRFFGHRIHSNEVAPDAHVACLRHDLAKAQVLPTEHQDIKLAARCEELVAAVLANDRRAGHREALMLDVSPTSYHEHGLRRRTEGC